MVDPLEELDEDEKIAVITDILSSEAMKNDVKVENPQWNIAKGIFGGDKRTRINNMDCLEVKLKVASHSEKITKIP